MRKFRVRFVRFVRNVRFCYAIIKMRLLGETPRPFVVDSINFRRETQHGDGTTCSMGFAPSAPKPSGAQQDKTFTRRVSTVDTLQYAVIAQRESVAQLRRDNVGDTT